jgi:nitrile hydratase
LVEAGLITQQEINKRVLSKGHQLSESIAARPSDHPVRFPLREEPFPATTQRGIFTPAGFSLGDYVIAHSLGGSGHTRLPSYVRGIRGQVVSAHGAWVFPDANAHGEGESPKHLYTVCYQSRDLWGANAEAGVVLNIDLFEPYLTLAK